MSSDADLHACPAGFHPAGLFFCRVGIVINVIYGLDMDSLGFCLYVSYEKTYRYVIAFIYACDMMIA